MIGIANLRSGIAGTGLSLLAALAQAQQPAETATRLGEIRDLHYGEVLFHFYQEDYFSAIVKLMAAQEQGRLARSEAESELLLGGLFLSYGLHDDADALFRRVLDQFADTPVRDRAWFYLAKIWYQRGYLDQAEQALLRISAQPQRDLANDRTMLHAQVLMRAGRYDEASQVLSAWAGPVELAGYSRYNLGVSLVRLGRQAEGIALLQQVGEMEANSEEMRSLKDQANVALGFAHLQANQPELARPALARVRLAGPFTTRALLGAGWADSAMGDYQRALVPWLALHKRNLADEAVQESLLAVPYAFGELQADGQAAAYYQQAIETFEAEGARIQQAVAKVRAGELVDGLLQANVTDQRGWFWQLSKVPATSENQYLYELLARHGFQESLKNYRDLAYLASNLELWDQSLEAFQDMLDTRRVAFQRRLPVIEEGLSRIDLEHVEQDRLDMHADLSRIAQEDDVLGLASSEEYRQWLKLLDIERRMLLMPDSPQRESLVAKHRILKGVLAWQLSEAFPARLWRERKGLKELDREVTEGQRLHQRVKVAREQVPVFLDRMQRQVSGLGPRVDALYGQIAELMLDQRNHIDALAMRELEQRQQRLDTYLIQARYALAAIYDRSARNTAVRP